MTNVDVCVSRLYEMAEQIADSGIRSDMHRIAHNLKRGAWDVAWALRYTSSMVKTFERAQGDYGRLCLGIYGCAVNILSGRFGVLVN